MGVCDPQELDRLENVRIVDTADLPPACPQCWEELDPSDIVAGSCPVCGRVIADDDDLYRR